MKLHRIEALFLRHFYPLKRDFDMLSDVLYWPLVDLLLWGITGEWLASTGLVNAAGAILAGLVLWNVIWRSQAEVGRGLIEEIWNNNMINLFASPLQLKEWVVSVMAMSLLKMAATLSVLIPAAYFLYRVNVFHLSWWLVLFIASATLTGWWVGFIASGIVIYYGPKMQTVAWAFPGILLPFSAVYFPLSKLPSWVQPISRAIPTTYIFENMRNLLFNQAVDWGQLGLSFVLNAVYLCLSVVFFVWMFRKSQKLGLGRFG